MHGRSSPCRAARWACAAAAWSTWLGCGFGFGFGFWFGFGFGLELGLGLGLALLRLRELLLSQRRAPPLRAWSGLGLRARG